MYCWWTTLSWEVVGPHARSPSQNQVQPSLFMPTRASRTQMDSPCDGPEHITGVPALVDEEGIEQVVIPSDEDDKLSMQKHMRSIVEEAGEPLCRICMCEA